MQPVPLIGAENVVRITSLLGAQGIPADRYLERARISPKVRERPGDFLPGRSVWEFVGAVDRGEGLRDFWLDIARTSGWRRAAWVRALTHAVTLGDAIRAMCISYARQMGLCWFAFALDTGQSTSVPYHHNLEVFMSR